MPIRLSFSHLYVSSVWSFGQDAQSHKAQAVNAHFNPSINISGQISKSPILGLKHECSLLFDVKESCV